MINSLKSGSKWAQVRPLPQVGANRQFFQYGDLAVNRVTQLYNAYCTEHGVQCTVTADPTDFVTLFHFKSFSDKLIKIEYKGEAHYLEPNQSVTIKVSQYDLTLGDRDLKFPTITALNNGGDFDQQVLQAGFYDGSMPRPVL